MSPIARLYRLLQSMLLVSSDYRIMKPTFARWLFCRSPRSPREWTSNLVARNAQRPRTRRIAQAVEHTGSRRSCPLLFHRKSRAHRRYTSDRRRRRLSARRTSAVRTQKHPRRVPRIVRGRRTCATVARITYQTNAPPQREAQTSMIVRRGHTSARRRAS